MKNKILLAIADGVGDRPCEVLGWQTPLEAAHTPHLDLLAKNGSSGIMDLHQLGTPVGTDLGHMILFGYSLEDYPGRGPIEAFGEGLELQEGDIAFRANFATVDEAGLVVDRRAGRIREGAKELAQALNGMKLGDVEVLFKEATEHRAVLVLRGANLSAAVVDTDPKVEGKPPKAGSVKEKAIIALPVAEQEAEKVKAVRTAELLQAFLDRAHEVLEEHPINKARVEKGLLSANYILTRGAGIMPHLEKTAERLGFKAACIAAESTVLGVASMAGYTPITNPKMTGNLDTDIACKAATTLEALRDNDLVVLHMKAPDLMGHDNHPLGKKEAVLRFDEMVGLVLAGLETATDANVIVALAADHSTPCERREHSGDPVPAVISGKNIRKDSVTTYNEMAAAEGGLGHIKGADFSRYLLDYLEVTEKRGN